MPASIWNSFRNSHKHHIVITGGRGAGKTTLLRGLFPRPLPGITTYAEPKKAVYLQENGTDSQATVGVYDDTLPGTENEMRPCTEILSSLGLSILNRLSRCEGDGRQ